MRRLHVTLKLATSLDGRIATSGGESRWITGPEARAEAHRLRAQCGAVMVGVGTARADDPELTVRTDPPPRKQPLRIVLDSRFSLPLDRKLVRTARETPLLVIGAEGADAAQRLALEATGAETAVVIESEAGVDLHAALSRLEERSLDRLLVEGGGKLAAGLIKAGLVDRFEWMRAPIVLGAEGVPAIGPLALERLSEAPTFRRVALRELGPDLWESYERA
ncbi:MAG TPA: RibD family protein [Caulobacterales bacterium]|nr:RibD family protein [Caulobacterales bacterium]